MTTKKATANDVANDLAKHEIQCAERWKTAFNEFSDIKEEISNINSTIKMAGENADSTRTLVEIIITGTIRKDAIGQFTNIVSINGNDYRVNVGYVVPEKGELSVTKSTTKMPATYIPGESIGFHVAVENTGLGYLTDVNISDLVSNITTDFAAQSRLGNVFEQWDVTDIVITGVDPSLSQPISGTEITGTNGYAIDYNIAPMQTVNLHLEGKVNDKAMGDITNEVVVTDSDGNKKTARIFLGGAAYDRSNL